MAARSRASAIRLVARAPRLVAAVRRFSTGPLRPYRELVAAGRLRADASQLWAAQTLQRFAEDGKPAGAYLYGAVGSGKSMLMDLLASSSAGVERMHFHELMQDVHRQLHALHSSRPKHVVLSKLGLPVYSYGDASPPLADAAGGDGANTATGTAEAAAAAARTADPLQRVVGEIAGRCSLLCLDEMQVTDVADALLLRQLFEGLLDGGVRVVFTSNRQPEGLYERGLNRRYFLPFVHMLRERFDVLRVGGDGDSAIDYRRLPPPPAAPRLAGSLGGLASRPRGAFLHGEGASAALRTRWQQQQQQQQQQDDAGGRGEPLAASLEVAFGRTLAVPVRSGDAAWFTFDELCARSARGSALGSADYLALASAARVVYVSGLPTLTLRQRNEARRFVTLVDALYEARTRVFISADAPLADCFAPLLRGDAAGQMLSGAEVAVDGSPAAGEGSRAPMCSPGVESGAATVGGAGSPSFEEAPVAGKYREDGELASFFTAKDEAFMLRRTVSRLTEMCAEAAE